MSARASRLALGAGLAAFALAAAAATTPARTASAPARGAAPGVAASAAPAAPASDAVEFTGTLTTGTTYFGDMAYDAHALKTWRPLRPVKVAKNVAWALEWANIDKFPSLSTPEGRARAHRFRFRVVKTDSSSGSPSLPWMTTYRCEILSAEPVGAPAPPPKPPPAKKR